MQATSLKGEEEKRGKEGHAALQPAHGRCSILPSAISNGPPRGFYPPAAQRADCLESGSQDSEETGGCPRRESMEAGERAWGGRADDHSNQRQVWTKAGVISAVWVTNCWTSGLNGLSGRKTANKEGRTQVELGLL